MKQGLSLVALLCAACARSQARSFFHSESLVPRGLRELLPSQRGTWTRRRPRSGSDHCLIDARGDLGTAASLAVRLRGGADADDDDDFKEEVCFVYLQCVIIASVAEKPARASFVC
jgi:hypothetical protein